LNPGHFGGSTTFIFVSCGESSLLVSLCAGDRCSMACSDEDHGRSRRVGAEGRDGCTGQVLSGRTIKRLGGAVCGLYFVCGDEKHMFLG
jgi:hypothetical protein